jgi:hypothetical protein
VWNALEITSNDADGRSNVIDTDWSLDPDGMVTLPGACVKWSQAVSVAATPGTAWLRPRQGPKKLVRTPSSNVA